MGTGDPAVFGDLGDQHALVLDLVDAGVGDPLDVVLAQLALEQALGVADAVESEMADVGLRGDERHRHAVADAGVAQRLVEDEGELVGRAEAGGALHGADHHRAGIGDQGVDRGLGLQRMIDLADRLGVGLRAEPLDLVEGEFGSGGDDHVVVVDDPAVVELDAPLRRVDALRALRMQRDAAGGERRRQLDLDQPCGRASRPPPTGLDGTKAKVGAVVDDRDVVRLAQLLAQLIGHDSAAEPGSENNHVRHVHPPSVRSLLHGGTRGQPGRGGRSEP